MTSLHNLTSEKLAVYRATAHRRRKQEQSELDNRRKQAWSAARQAARLLKTEFKANRVVVFGSLVQGGFTRWSDVDVAAWGIAPTDTFRAIGAILDMDTEIEVNLVDVNTCQSSLLEVIEQDGLDL